MLSVGTNLAAVLLIAALITIHEFGHFIVAKACGVRVKVFSVGIGGRLFGFRWGDTDYRVSWFPFGGYVRMAGADPFMEGGADDEDPRAPGGFMAQPAWKRLLIVFAGPAMNLVLPFVVFTALKVAGEPQPQAEVGVVYADSIAAAAGVQAEDEITSVDGTPTRTWYDVIAAFSASKGPAVDLVVERQGTAVPLALDVVKGDYGDARDPYDFGLGNVAPDPTVAVDDPASPAGRAGLHTGDTLTKVDGQPVRNWNEVRRLALAAAGRPLEVEVRRASAKDAASEVDTDAAPAVDPDPTVTPVETLTLAPDPTWAPAPEPADDALWRSWGIASATLTVGSFSKDAAAAKAGVSTGDRLLAVDARPVLTWRDVVRAVGDSATGEGTELAAHPLAITVRRAGQVLHVDVTPDVVKDTDELGRYRRHPLLGIGGAGTMVAAPMIPRPYPLGEAMAGATQETVTVASFIVEQLGKLTTGEAAPEESLGGPVEIFRQTKAAAQRGIFDYARHLGLFSISLGIINLLPIPVLDGGQFVMYLAEWIRGRPLPLVLRERAQQAGVIFLVLLMLFVFVFDIHRYATLG
jgi:regulator of sigma E protease